MELNVEGAALLSLLERSRIYISAWRLTSLTNYQSSLDPSDKMTRNGLKFGHDRFRPHNLQMIIY